MDRIKYEVFFSNSGWYAHAHCDCGSTMSSGDSFANVDDAIRECSENMESHLTQARSEKCGYGNQKVTGTTFAAPGEELSQEQSSNLKACIADVRTGIRAVKECLADAEWIETDLVIATKLPPNNALAIVDLMPDRIMALHSKLASVLA